MAKNDLKQRLREKKEALKKRGAGGMIIRQKEEGTIRVRILPTGDDNDFVKEITQFWLGKDLGSVISPSTFGDECALLEAYKELKESKDDEDKELAKNLMPKKRYVVPVLVYKDDKGKKIDTDQSGKLLQITGGLYQNIIDLYLDEDEWGDMTDAKKGYDLKITRDGLKMMDTTYSVQPCKNTPIDKKFRKDVDLDEMVKTQVATFEETLEKKNKWFNSDEDTSDKKKKKDKKKPSKKKVVKKKGKKKKGKDI